MTVAVTGAGLMGSTVVGCSGGADPGAFASDKTASQAQAIQAVIADGGADGGALSATIARPFFYYPDQNNKAPGTEIYALQIGPNFHNVSGCQRADINSIVGNQFAAIQELRPDNWGQDPDTNQPWTMGARFSCGSEPGDLPYATTSIYQDDTGRYYFPTGIAHQYYSLTDQDTCLSNTTGASSASLRASLLKLDDRLSNDPLLPNPGVPGDMWSNIALTCDSGPPPNDTGAYHLWAYQDTIAGSDAFIIVIESNENGKKTYLPVYNINGGPPTTDTTPVPLPDAGDGDSGVTDAGTYPSNLALLAAWLQLPAGTMPDLLTTSADFQDSTVAPGSSDDVVAAAATAKIHAYFNGRRLWDICVPDTTPGDPPPACTSNHLIYIPSDATDPTVPNVPVPTSYRSNLLIDGTSQESIVDTAPTAGPAFFGCDGQLRSLFALTKDTTPVDQRLWARTQAANLLSPPANVDDPRFRCPQAAANVCALSLGGKNGPDIAETTNIVALNQSIGAAYSRCAVNHADTLEITLNSDLNVLMMPAVLGYAYMSFSSFKEVHITSATGKRALQFIDQCDQATPSPCLYQSTDPIRRLIMANAMTATRTLMLNQVNVGYTAQNFVPPTAPGGGTAGANQKFQSVLLVDVEGSATARSRLVLTDSALGADPESQKAVSQSLMTKQTDVFVVRSTIANMTTSPNNTPNTFRTVDLSDSLLVLTGTPPKADGTGGKPSQLLGDSGSLRTLIGHNDVLSSSSIIESPILSNPISQGNYINSTLLRATGKEGVHFSGADVGPYPPSYNMNFAGPNARVVNFQRTLPTPTSVPFAQFDVGMGTIARVNVTLPVQYFDLTSSGTLAAPLDQNAISSAIFCTTPKGSIKVRSNGVLAERCPTH